MKIARSSPNALPESSRTPRFDGQQMVVCLDAATFARKMPAIFRQTAAAAPLPSRGSSSTFAFNAMRDAASRFLVNGPKIFEAAVFAPFAQKQGWRQETEFGVLVRRPQTQDEKAMWRNHLATCRPSRLEVVDAVSRLVGSIRLPSTRYLEDSGVAALGKRLELARYAVALEFLPDITDAEARQIFGQLATATVVRAHAQKSVA